jgi:hypothetical protein
MSRGWSLPSGNPHGVSLAGSRRSPLITGPLRLRSAPGAHLQRLPSRLRQPQRCAELGRNTLAHGSPGREQGFDRPDVLGRGCYTFLIVSERVVSNGFMAFRPRNSAPVASAQPMQITKNQTPPGDNRAAIEASQPTAAPKTMMNA